MAEQTKKSDTDAANGPSAGKGKASTESPEATTAGNPPPDGGKNGGDKRDAADDPKALRDRLTAAERDRDEYLKLAKSARADFENYQIRAQRDRAEERRYAQMPLAHDLLGPLDNLQRATLAAQQAGEKGALAQGVAMVVAQMVDVLRRHGITPVEAMGKPFDPNLHQAVMQQPSEDHAPNTVVQVLEQGYTMHDRVLRPARVAVSAAPQPKD
jgi:molecular chaperone GrpE